MAACPDLSYVTRLCALPLGTETIPVNINEILFYTKRASGEEMHLVHSLACSILALQAPTMTDVRVGLGYEPVPLEPAANLNISMRSASLISSSAIRRTPSDRELEAASPGSAERTPTREASNHARQYSIDTPSPASRSTSSTVSERTLSWGTDGAGGHSSDTEVLERPGN
jgi:hypothetical protein